MQEFYSQLKGRDFATYMNIFSGKINIEITDIAKELLCFLYSKNKGLLPGNLYNFI